MMGPNDRNPKFAQIPTLVRHGLGNATCREVGEWYATQPWATKRQVRREHRATCTAKEWQQCEEGAWIILGGILAVLGIPFTLYQAWCGVSPLIMVALALGLAICLIAAIRGGWHQLVAFAITGDPPVAPRSDCKRVLED
ncbi:MAG: hypothetical protein G01um101431_868 [Parcubacteria group bacterium Gr01-1014_31]|nr:MAG: hypothetical protein G01um101431_868 [Parcubacteria group bacterium Gr01-1014_31]